MGSKSNKIHFTIQQQQQHATQTPLKPIKFCHENQQFHRDHTIQKGSRFIANQLKFCVNDGILLCVEAKSTNSFQTLTITLQIFTRLTQVKFQISQNK